MRNQGHGYAEEEDRRDVLPENLIVGQFCTGANTKGTLRIHGGAAGPGYVDPTQRYLRPTNGCFRLTNSDMVALLKALGDSQIGFPFGLEVGEGQDFPLNQGGADTGEPPFRDD
jgi:hypothetical protein